jgi:hypothetical protein
VLSSHLAEIDQLATHIGILSQLHRRHAIRRNAPGARRASSAASDDQG